MSWSKRSSDAPERVPAKAQRREQATPSAADFFASRADVNARPSQRHAIPARAAALAGLSRVHSTQQAAGQQVPAAAGSSAQAAFPSLVQFAAGSQAPQAQSGALLQPSPPEVPGHGYQRPAAERIALADRLSETYFGATAQDRGEAAMPPGEFYKQELERDRRDPLPAGSRIYNTAKRHYLEDDRGGKKMPFEDGAALMMAERCGICMLERPAASTSYFTDQVVPVSGGGEGYVPGNIQPSCFICNRSKLNHSQAVHQAFLQRQARFLVDSCREGLTEEHLTTLDGILQRI